MLKEFCLTVSSTPVILSVLFGMVLMLLEESVVLMVSAPKLLDAILPKIELVLKMSKDLNI
jgi:hypothetical protein